jgi:isoleucyl-tRNA synthetase
MFLSCAIEHQAPYKGVLTHGFTVDEKGEKMSKSKGNVIAPEQVIKEYGSEILRLWVASSDYQGDLKISKGILKQTAENYRKLRNTFRFLMANIDDLEAIVEPQQMGVLDRWILSLAAEVLGEVHKAFSEYNFVGGMSLLNNFIVNELSGIYLDITKDRLYCDAKTDIHRRASQSAMALITRTLLTLLAPILTYTMDEIVEHAPEVIKGEAEDIFDFTHNALPQVASEFDAEYFLQAREKFYEIVDSLKKEKTIKATLELSLYTDSKKVLDIDPTEAEDWFVVSGVDVLQPCEVLGEFKVEDDTFVIAKAKAYKCPRCWKYHAPKEDALCERCEKVLNA